MGPHRSYEIVEVEQKETEWVAALLGTRQELVTQQVAKVGRGKQAGQRVGCG